MREKSLQSYLELQNAYCYLGTDNLIVIINANKNIAPSCIGKTSNFIGDFPNL